jgi:hypothetical protein
MKAFNGSYTACPFYCPGAPLERGCGVRVSNSQRASEAKAGETKDDISILMADSLVGNGKT